MNLFEKFLYLLQGTMDTPKPFGWFHLLWIGLTIIIIFILYKLRKYYNDKQLKTVLLIYGLVSFILELIKQLIWAFNYDPITNLVTWDYEWYSAPFQLCTTPIFISLICLFLKKNKIRDSLLSYMAFVTILGGITTILMPDSCFVSTIEVNIHTMWLHCGSFVVSVYLLMTGEVEIKKENLLKAFKVFLMFVGLAELLNISVYHSGILNGETFNMFYISPYFITHLPIFNVVQENLPFIFYLLFYISVIFMGTVIVYLTAYLIKKSRKKCIV